MLVPVGIIMAAVIWGLLVAGIGAAIASLARHSRVALLTYVGIFLIFGLIFPWLLEWATESDQVWILSPMMAMLAQSPWLFGFASSDVGFPAWWGLIAIILLILVSWAVFLLRQPHARGEEGS
jgi:Na+/melibiose symporter-like transporter